MNLKNMPTKNRRLPDQNGYLLIEIMIAMAIFAIGFLAIGTLILSTTRNNTTSNIATQATMLAVERLEQLKSSDVSAMTGDNGQPEQVGIFERSWTVTDTGIGASRLIEVTVSWDRMGQNRDVVLSTISKGNGT